MKNIASLVFVFFFSIFASAQQSSSTKKNETVTNQKTATENKDLSEDLSNINLEKILSSKVLLAYQENSKTKVEDLFGYFQMLTDASLTDDFKKEVVENINQLFKNKSEQVIDLTSNSFDIVPLDVLITNLLISEPIVFSISDEAQYNSVSFQSWKTGYTITLIKAGISQKIKAVQTIYFYKNIKNFGTSIKSVDQTKLGEMRN